MLIKFLHSISGNDFCHDVGTVIDWEDKAEALRFIEAGYAEAVDAEPKLERAVKAAAPEKRNGPKPGKKG